MERALTVIFTSRTECYVIYSGTAFYVAPDSPLLMPAAKGSGIVITVWGVNDIEKAMIQVPEIHHIHISDDGKVSSSLKIIDWKDVLEAELEPVSILSPIRENPVLLDKTEFFYGERRSAAELYRDGGLRLALTPRGGETFSFSLGEGSDGMLSVVDFGSARLLSVTAKLENKERLILINGRAETVFDRDADKARIEEGYPTLITELGTVKGHQRRERYSFSDAGNRLYSSDIGFYTHDAHTPRTDPEKALSAAQEIRLGVYDGKEFLSRELADSIGLESLRDYLGEYDRERLYPVEEQNGCVTVGLFTGKDRIAVPRRFIFEFVDGLISDIREL